MKLNNLSKSLFAFIAFLLSTTTAFAQDGLDIDVNLGREEWYQNPTYLILGGVILVLLVVLATRKKS